MFQVAFVFMFPLNLNNLFVLQVDVLQAEVTALKHLVLTSTNSPHRPKGELSWRRHSTEHLLPCLECGSYDCDAAVPRFNGPCVQGSRHRKYALSDEPEVCAPKLKI